MTTKRQQIIQWHHQGLIKTENLERSFAVTNATITRDQWVNFIQKGLVFLAFSLLAAGIIFFFAYNWVSMSKFVKFALLQGAIIVSLIAYSPQKPQSLLATGLLFFIAFLIGALFALFGQTYQTGKDPWELFFLWTLVITPLAFIAKSSSLWILWLVLANLTLYLFMDVRHGLFGVLFNEKASMLSFALLNASSAFLFSFLAHKNRFLLTHFAFYTAMFCAMICFSYLGFFATGLDISAPTLSYFAWMGLVFYLYRKRSLDIVVLSPWVLSVILFITTLVGRTIENELGGWLFLLLSILLISLSTIGTKWLMALLQEKEVNNENA